MIASTITIRQGYEYDYPENIVLGPNISKKAGDRGSVPVDHRMKWHYDESNGHVIDNVT